jgi:hypothetical protein
MSFRLVDKVKKSCLPGHLKAILEAYLSFGNKDGTSIRPTAVKVGKRAGRSQRTVERYAPVLVKLGLLVHERDTDGNFLTHNYAKAGVWAYVYHADLSSLDNPQIVASFELQKAILSEKRRAAAESKGSRQLALFDTDKVAETHTDNLSETLSANLSETPTAKMSDRPDPIAPTLRSVADQTQTDPSAVSTAVSKKESKQVSPSLAMLATAPSAPPLPSAEKKNPTPQGLGLVSEAKKNQPQDPDNPHPISEIEEEFWTEEIFTERGELMCSISPKPSVAAIEKGLPLCDRILEHFDTVQEGYKGLAATMVLKYNRTHRGHQYATKDDRKLYIRTPEQYLKALDSDNAALINDYLTHDFDNCELCLQAGVFGYRKLIAEIITEERKKEERKRAAEIQRAEEERKAKLCARCEKVPFGKMTLEGAKQPWNGNHAVLKVCDSCYDAEYESRVSGRGGLRVNLIDPRPGYLEPRRPAEEAAKPRCTCTPYQGFDGLVHRTGCALMRAAGPRNSAAAAAPEHTRKGFDHEEAE